MIAVWAFPAFAALQCTSLEVSSSRNYGLPIKQTVTLTLHNAAASTAVIIKPGLTFYQFQDDLMLTSTDGDLVARLGFASNRRLVD
jgi:hypothetical protein